MKNKTVFYNRHLPHYRKGIYLLMDKTLNLDFFTGNKRPGNIKKMDYSLLSNFKFEFRNYDFGPFYFQKGAISLAFKNYKNYLTPGDYHCISNWILFFFCKLLKKKIIIWTHGWHGNESFGKIILKKIYYSFANDILLYGDYAKELMIKAEFNKNKLHVIYNSLDYDVQLQIRKNLKPTNIYNLHFKNKNKNLIYIGRLTKRKNLTLLLYALNYLKGNSLNFNLTIIGDGEEKKSLVDLANKYDLSQNLWFYGACYDETKNAEMIYNSDLCVSPGDIGLTAVHAMMYGIPVISHDKFSNHGPEFEAINEGLTGGFFEHNNYKSLAEKINEWFQTEPSRESTQKKCYEIIDSKYNPHYQIEILKKVLS